MYKRIAAAAEQVRRRRGLFKVVPRAPRIPLERTNDRAGARGRSQSRRRNARYPGLAGKNHQTKPPAFTESTDPAAPSLDRVHLASFLPHRPHFFRSHRSCRSPFAKRIVGERKVIAAARDSDKLGVAVSADPLVQFLRLWPSARPRRLRRFLVATDPIGTTILLCKPAEIGSVPRHRSPNNRRRKSRLFPSTGNGWKPEESVKRRGIKCLSFSVYYRRSAVTNFIEP